MDILNPSTSFPYNGHRFRVGVDDGRTCDCGHIADSLLDRWRHLYAVGALISCTKQLTHQRTTHASNNSADDSFTATSKSCGATLRNRRTRTTPHACCRLLVVTDSAPDCDCPAT